ncbi:MAG: MCE family protein [Gammaproteobacteria bacterium]|nr:MCE family protein [Gammaproteobacteria bacterium]
MESKPHYVIVGIFALLLGTATVGLSLWLAFGDLALEYRTYRIYTNESVAGLYVDSLVKYRGVEVGRVRALELDPDNPEQVRITVDIAENVRIKEDTVAKLAVQGVTGIASVELSGGTAGAPDLEATPGEPYPVIQAVPSLFTRMDAAVSELIGNLNTAAADLHTLLNPEVRGHLANTLKHIDELSETLAGQREAMAGGIEAFSRFADNAADASEQMPALVARVDAAVTALETMADDIAATTREVREQVRAGGDRLETLGNRTLPEAELLLGEIRRLTASFQRLSDRLEEDPRALLYGPQLTAPGPGE